MARDRYSDEPHYGRSIRRVLFGILLLVLAGLFVLWRIDSPRVEQMRTTLIDRLLPGVDWALVPTARLARMMGDFQSYARLYDQNQELRRELQRLKGWREAALQLEQQNAKLMELNKVRINPRLSFVTAVVLADSSSPFRRSALINIGRRDGVVEGWATMDGLGLVGRIAGVGEATSRVIFLTDINSRIPVTVLPSGQRAIMAGVNGPYPVIEFLETPETVHPGDRVVSSGDGAVFPPDILAGHIVMGRDGRFLVQLAAEFDRLEFLRVMRSDAAQGVDEPDALIGVGSNPPAPRPPTGKT
ncbi:MAG: rod shape-determining protein MreC, partial [Paracoccaceae bacterium]